MVFFVVPQEGNAVILVGYTSAEEGYPERHHFFIIGSAEDDMGEGCGTEDCGPRLSLDCCL